MKEIDDEKYLFMATRNGMVKKTPMKEYSNVRKNGLQAIVLRDDDELIEVKITGDDEEEMDDILEDLDWWEMNIHKRHFR